MRALIACVLLAALLHGASAQNTNPPDVSIWCSSEAGGGCFCGFTPSVAVCNLTAATLQQGFVVFVNPRSDVELSPNTTMLSNATFAQPLATCGTDGDPLSAAHVFDLDEPIYFAVYANVTLRSACAALPVVLRKSFNGTAGAQANGSVPAERDCTLVRVSTRIGVSVNDFALDGGTCNTGAVFVVAPRPLFFETAGAYPSTVQRVRADLRFVTSTVAAVAFSPLGCQASLTVHDTVIVVRETRSPTRAYLLAVSTITAAGVLLMLPLSDGSPPSDPQPYALMGADTNITTLRVTDVNAPSTPTAPPAADVLDTTAFAVLGLSCVVLRASIATIEPCPSVHGANIIAWLVLAAVCATLVVILMVRACMQHHARIVAESEGQAVRAAKVSLARRPRPDDVAPIMPMRPAPVGAGRAAPPREIAAAKLTPSPSPPPPQPPRVDEVVQSQQAAASSSGASAARPSTALSASSARRGRATRLSVV